MTFIPLMILSGKYSAKSMSRVSEPEINRIILKSKLMTEVLSILNKEKSLTKEDRSEVLVHVLKINCLEEEL